MVALGFGFLVLFALAFWYAAKQHFQNDRGCSRGAVVHAHAVDRLRIGLVRRRIRPPALDHLRRAADPPVRLDAVAGSLYGSLAGFICFYTGLLVVEMYLMFKFAAPGPGRPGQPAATRTGDAPVPSP